ncbi:MAG TPA: alpha/beta fold hydrolase [Pedococcus sp.]|nr:alpha/beta fold hydrolase [Pedococcus sp.]
MILAHDVDGDGPAVLLLHSGVCDRRMWEPLLPALTRAHRVVRPDLRGFGDSPLPGEVYADADDLAALLDSLGVAEAAVVGSSYGGRAAMELATRHPGRVSSLVLLCPAYRGVDPDEELQAFGAEEERLLEAGDVEGAVRLNVRTFLGPDADEATADRVAQMQRRSFAVQLAADALEPGPQPERVEVDPSRLAAPTLVVSGALDLAHFGEVATVLATQVPGAEHVELPWAGHLPSLERPDEVAAMALEALERQSEVRTS